MVTEEQAREYVDVEDTVDLSAYLATAVDLISAYVGAAEIPDSVRDNATLQLVQELFTRRRSPGGITNFAGVDTVVRLSRDPMASIYPLLKPWAVGSP